MAPQLCLLYIHSVCSATPRFKHIQHCRDLEPSLFKRVCVEKDCPQWFLLVLQLLVYMTEEIKCAGLVNKYLQSTWA